MNNSNMLNSGHFLAQFILNRKVHRFYFSEEAFQYSFCFIFSSAARQGVPPVFCCSDFSFYSEAALRILPQTVSSVRTVQVGPAPSDDVVFANLQC